jgi:hypothetical protein
VKKIVCPVCQELKNSKCVPKGFSSLEEEITDIELGNGYSRSVYALYECSNCKSRWSLTQDSGAGGKDSFWKKRS